MTTQSFATVLAAALLAVAPAFAERQLQAHVPFDFTVGATHMSAGEYTLSFDVPGTIRIVRDDFTQVSVALTTPVHARKPLESGKLVFNRYGESYFLSQIWGPGLENGRELRKTKAELEIARNQNGVRQASVPANPRRAQSTSR